MILPQNYFSFSNRQSELNITRVVKNDTPQIVSGNDLKSLPSIIYSVEIILQCTLMS